MVVDSGARLDRLPISRFHYRMLLLIAAGGFVDAFDVYLSGSVMAAMTHDKQIARQMPASQCPCKPDQKRTDSALGLERPANGASNSDRKSYRYLVVAVLF